MNEPFINLFGEPVNEFGAKKKRKTSSRKRKTVKTAKKGKSTFASRYNKTKKKYKGKVVYKSRTNGKEYVRKRYVKDGVAKYRMVLISKKHSESKKRSVMKRSKPRLSKRRSRFGYCGCGSEAPFNGFGGVHGNAAHLSQMSSPYTPYAGDVEAPALAETWANSY